MRGIKLSNLPPAARAMLAKIEADKGETKHAAESRRKSRDGARRQQESRIALMLAHGLPRPETELRFHPDRRWRFDFAWPSAKVALEVHGGVWVHGHHSRGKNQMDDWEKLNAAQLLGWRVFQCSPQQLDKGEIIETIRRAISGGD